MRIKSKLALVLLFSGVLLFAFFAFYQNRLRERTTELQEDLAITKAKSFASVYELMREPYHNYVVDMTFWDETVEFVSEQDLEWAATNIDASADTFDIDFILVFNLKRELIHAFLDGERPQLSQEIAGVVDWEEVFQPGERFCSFHVELGGNLYEIDGASIHPTDDPERLTEPRGFLVIGRVLDDAFLAELGVATGSRIRIDRARQEEGADKWIQIDGNAVVISRPLRKASGAPLAMLRAGYHDGSLGSFSRFLRDHSLLTIGFLAAIGLALVMLASYWLKNPLGSIESALAREDLNALQAHARSHGDFAAVCGMLVEGIRQKRAVEHEIEERIAAQKQLLEARDEAERANRAKSEFLANMSHEIRTPMNAVLGFTELARGNVSDPQTSHYLGRIEYGGKMMLSLIDDILDMSKIEAGRMSLHPSATDVCGIMEGIVGVFAADAARKGLELKKRCPQQMPPPLMVDAAKFRQIMVNLLGNALKFTERGHIEIGLDWSLVGKEHVRLEITVKDTGIGIESVQQERIFDAFVQQDGQDSVRYGGTGLGLALSQRIARLMGAEITLESQLEHGSCFTVVWPELSIAGEPEVVPEAKAFPDKPLTARRILVAEDDAATQMMLRVCLRNAGATVTVAANGELAWQALSDGDFDLVLSDMQMPALEGLGLLERIRQTPELASMPFILMTASVTNEIRERTKALACFACLSKPCALDEIQRICGEAMAEQDRRQGMGPA